MNIDDAHESLLVLIGELLYKNQLLREAISSKEDAIETIISHLTNAATSGCPCGVAEQLEFVSDVVRDRDVGSQNPFVARRSELQKNRG